MKPIGKIVWEIHTAVCGFYEGGACGTAWYEQAVLEDEDGRRYLSPVLDQGGNYSSVEAEEYDLQEGWEHLAELGVAIPDFESLPTLAYWGIHGKRRGEMGLFDINEI